MSASIVASVGGALVGGYLANQAADKNSSSAQSAADTTASASRYAADIQKQVYDQTREDQTPWRTAGQNALAQLVSGMGPNVIDGEFTRIFTASDLTEDPGYKFRLQEGQKALERAAAAGGRLYSGRYLKDTSAFNSGEASQEYGNAYNRFNNNQTNKFNRLASVAGIGQTANSALESAGQSYATNVGNLITSSASDQATAKLVSGQGYVSAYNSLGNNLGNALSKINWGGTSSSTPSYSSDYTKSISDY